MKTFLSRNKYRIAFAAVVGLVAFVIAMPADAALQKVGAIPEYKPPVCIAKYSDLPHENAVSIVEIQGHATIDKVSVFLVMIDGALQYITVTSKRDCVIGVS